MARDEPVIELSDALASVPADHVPRVAVTFRLMPGELALVDASDAQSAAWFGDLCCGLVPLATGSASFLGHRWTALPDGYAAALRGRIGRVFASGAWVGFLDTATNILLPQLHHRREAREDLRAQATTLACAFGLPGLPLDQPSALAPIDLARAACVRAFLGDPALLLLEAPLQGQFHSLLEPVLNALAAARHSGAAAIWLTRNDVIWGDRHISADSRFRLRERGLIAIRRVA